MYSMKKRTQILAVAVIKGLQVKAEYANELMQRLEIPEQIVGGAAIGEAVVR